MPARCTPRTASMNSARLPITRATWSPGSNPMVSTPCPTALVRSSRSRHVNRRASSSTARSPGWRSVRSQSGGAASGVLVLLAGDPVDEAVDAARALFGDVGLGPLADLLVGEAALLQPVACFVGEDAGALLVRLVGDLFGHAGLVRLFGRQVAHAAKS